MKAKAELHYTRFADAAAFIELRDRHGLEYAGQNVTAELSDGHVTGVHAWCGEDLHLFTTCDPIDGDHAGIAGDKDPGYASYVTVVGERNAAEAVFRDVVEQAEYIKGEFDPLTTESGDVVVSLHDYDESLDEWGEHEPEENEEYWHTTTFDEDDGARFIPEMAGHNVTFGFESGGEVTRTLDDAYTVLDPDRAGETVHLAF